MISTSSVSVSAHQDCFVETDGALIVLFFFKHENDMEFNIIKYQIGVETYSCGTEYLDGKPTLDFIMGKS